MNTISIQKLIDVKLTQLIGKDVKGIIAQVTNPIYISEECPAAYRILTKIKTFKERGKMWVELYWERQATDSCGFTGCTIESDCCTIQMDIDDFNNLKPITKSKGKIKKL